MPAKPAISSADLGRGSTWNVRGQVRGISCRVFHVEHPSARQATSIDAVCNVRGFKGTAPPSPGGRAGVPRGTSVDRRKNLASCSTWNTNVARRQVSRVDWLLSEILEDPRTGTGNSIPWRPHRAFQVELPVPEPSRGFRAKRCQVCLEYLRGLQRLTSSVRLPTKMKRRSDCGIATGSFQYQSLLA